MEDKNVLDEEKIEKVSGGRHYVGKPIFRDSAQREELIKAAANLPSKPLPKEVVADVVGGVGGGITETYYEHCPNCGGWEVLETYLYGWEIYCPNCNIVWDASYIRDF